MVEIEFSLISTPRRPEALEQMLFEFRQQTGIRVRPRIMFWDTAWTELVKVAIYHLGPDVSEIGDTWLSSLVGMNALHPFSRLELPGKQTSYLEPSWTSLFVGDNPQPYAAPFLTETRLVFYRRDWLAKAGIAEAGAFQDHAAFVATLQKLQDCGVSVPWIAPTHKTHNTLQNAISWVWGAGGQLISLDGKHPLFHFPEAVKGFTQYFSLARFIPRVHLDVDDNAAEALFWQGEAAVIVSGPWLLRDTKTPQDVIANTGFASVPGVPFVGGSNLVVWEHASHPREAIALVKFLAGANIQSKYIHELGMLPVNLEALHAPPYSTTPLYQQITPILKSGRSFRLIPLWGLVEERLMEALSHVWDDVLKDPASDISAIVERHLTALAHLLEPILTSR